MDGARAWEVRDVTLPDGRRLRVRCWPGRGRPLVLLHGLFDDAEGWDALARDTRRPCYAFDLPGFGGSQGPTRPRVSAYAEDVVAGLEALEVAECTLVGHSLGGAIAVAVAERSPAVGALALLAPVGFGPIRLADCMTLPGFVDLWQFALPVALVNPLTVTAAYTTFVAHGRLPSRDLMARLRRRAFRSGPGVRAATVAIAASGHSARGFARREIAFDGPVAVVWGGRDALVPTGHIAALQRALPQAHVEVWDGMGHHPQRERPVALARFIERHASRRPRGRRPRDRADAA
jgi:pyruvate dehydrogenase E2 component (dihydrolipoamide acetyltransferase)